MSISLREIVLSIRYGDAALVGESAGYLVLGATDLAYASPSQIGLDSVLVDQDGQVALDSSPCSPAEAEAALRVLLGRLLELVRTPCPNLRRVADRAETRGLRALQGELEAALVPVNRKAARRSLARLVREAKKSSLKGRSTMLTESVAPAATPAAVTHRPPLGDAPVAKYPDSPGTPEVEEEVPTARLPLAVEGANRGFLPIAAAAPATESSHDGGRAASHRPREIPGASRVPMRFSGGRPRALPDTILDQLAAQTPGPRLEVVAEELLSADLVADESAEPGLGVQNQSGMGASSNEPEPPPELLIDTTPTQVYAPVTARPVEVVAREDSPVDVWPESSEVSSFALTPLRPETRELTVTPELSAVCEAVARDAEEEERLRSSPQNDAPVTATSAASADPGTGAVPRSTAPSRRRTPDGVSLLPESKRAPARRRSDVAELLDNMPVNERPDDELYAGLKRLSQLEMSPLAPPVGSSWIKS